MATTDTVQLNEIDPEDFEDTLLKIEKSFGVQFDYNSFNNVKTFGDICDIIEKQVQFSDKEDCTTQQAFYKIRSAICSTQNINTTIEPQTKLEYIFPRKNRIRNIKRFEKNLGFTTDILSMKNWLFLTLAISILISLIAFFFNWKLALASLTFFILLSWIMSKFSKELNITTVRELTEKISRENYSQVRRQKATVNKKEIPGLIQKIFIADYFMEKENLTREAGLGWG